MFKSSTTTPRTVFLRVPCQHSPGADNEMPEIHAGGGKWQTYMQENQALLSDQL